MNEQIRQLARDADLNWQRFWNDDESNKLENFANLIINHVLDQIRIVRTGEEIVAVTFVDEEHQIQKVIWEKQS